MSVPESKQASNEPLYPKQPFYPPQPLEAPIAPIYPAVGPTGIQAPVYTQPVHTNMPLHQFDSEPQHCICPHCKQEILTKVKYKIGAGTWVIAGSLCLSGFCFIVCLFGCQFLPFCLNVCKDAYHYCPNCRHLLGKRVLF